MTRSNSLKTLVVAAVTLFGVACKKDNSAEVNLAETISQEDVANTQAIAVAAVTTSSSSTARTMRDSIYLVNVCSKRSHKDSIAFSSLPATSLTYLTTNYAGYTSKKAYSIKDTSGVISGYVAVIQFNSQPVGVLFDATGTFVRVLEQREGGDLVGNGWHHGGVFEDRGGHKGDTISIATLPATITSYYASNYASDTLIAAYKNRDSSIVVLSKNNGIYSSVFNSAGTFVQRVQLPSKPGRPASVSLSALPSTAQSYLTTTYPNYVFKQAYSIGSNGTVKGYIVIIDANSTKYAVELDSAGTFVKAVTIR